MTPPKTVEVNGHFPSIEEAVLVGEWYQNYQSSLFLGLGIHHKSKLSRKTHTSLPATLIARISIFSSPATTSENKDRLVFGNSMLHNETTAGWCRLGHIYFLYEPKHCQTNGNKHSQGHLEHTLN